MKKENEVLNEVERLNLEIINLKQSKEYTIGKKILIFKELLKELKFITILKKVQRYKKIGLMMSGQKKENDDYEKLKQTVSINSNFKYRVAVYTCITGDYDSIPDIHIKESCCDYYLITNNKKIKDDKWKIIYINEEDFKQFDNSKLNRFFKLNPYYYFEKNYDFSIYIDGNVNIISSLSDLCEKVNEKIGLTMHKHKDRDCVYDEAKACEILKKGNHEKILKLIDKYKKENFPNHYGMVECTLIVTRLNNMLAKDIYQKWWNLLIDSDCGRDQLILPYILWKKNIEIIDISTLGNNIYKNPKFRIGVHK